MCVCVCVASSRMTATIVFLTCPRAELGRGNKAAVAQHPHSGGGHQPVGEPPERPGHGQSPDPEERRLHLPQHEISAGRHTCTPHTRVRADSRTARIRREQKEKDSKCKMRALTEDDLFTSALSPDRP